VNDRRARSSGFDLAIGDILYGAMTTGEPQLGYDLFFVVNLFPTVA
jgi:hypothetical protein